MRSVNGRKIAAKIKEDIQKEITGLSIKAGLAVILVGQDPASHLYVDIKERTAKKLGINFEKYLFSENESEEKIIGKIQELNERPDINGVIVQLPLPRGFEEDRIVQTIIPKKDVDAFTPKSPFQPPIGQAALEIIKEAGSALEDKKIVIIGRGKTGGKPINDFLKKQGFNPIILHTQISPEQSKKEIKEADILISAVGKPNFINGEMIKKGAGLIDVGTYRDEQGNVLGDINIESVKEKAEWLSPSPGGIGSITVAFLLKNVILAANLVK